MCNGLITLVKLPIPDKSVLLCSNNQLCNDYAF